MIVEDWGLISYSEASARQLLEVKNYQSDKIIICTHPPVVTLGRGTLPSDVISWQGEVQQTSRGGRATYHGPSQVVVYPIINLENKNRKFIGHHDIRSYMSMLEQTLIDTLNEYGVKATTQPTNDGIHQETEPKVSYTGVWVNDKKIASIGIAVKKWITYHGLSINFQYDPTAFQGIHPCGFNSNVMVSLEELLPEKKMPHRQEFCSVMQNILIQKLS